MVQFQQGRKIVSQYHGSKFLVHTRAVDLLKSFKEAVKDFDVAKMLQISMDGPSTNFKCLQEEELIDDRNRTDPGIPQLLELGSCILLHIITGAFPQEYSRQNAD